MPAETETKKKKKRSLLSIIKDTIVPGQMGRTLLGGVNKKIEKTKKKPAKQ